MKHYAARALIFAFPDPAAAGEKKPLSFDKTQPFKNLGIREAVETGANTPLAVQDIDLTMREFSGTNGIQQILKELKV